MSTSTYFDTHHETMSAVTAQEGIKALCYDQQAALVESLIEPGMTVLDVGCGPALPYDTRRAYVIGLDPSAASLRANTDVDQRIVGTAENIPLPDASVDLVVCFYSLHHVTGAYPDNTCWLRHRALNEMWRVLRPGGEMLVFEVSPHPWAAKVQDWFWPIAKQLLGDRLDAYFWTTFQFIWEVPRVTAAWQTFDCSPFEAFPPILSLPWLRIPRFLYPFDAVALRWRKEAP